MTENFIHDNNHDDVTITTSQSSSSVGRPISDDNLIISPPFPPNIDPQVLALELFNKGGKRTKKMLNEFFLFRKEFVRELKRQNLHPRQTKVSALASTSWHKQKPSVKDEYRRLAREVERLFMIERQREANESSSTDDSVPSPTEPSVNHFQLPLNHLPSDDSLSTILNNQNNVRLTTNYQEYPTLYNQYPDRQYIRQTNIAPTSQYRNFNHYYPYVDQVVVPSQNLQEYFTPNYSS
ncbi:hypothetical protein GLOIN_2v1541737 [Rhizophagus clarus]|nr:hypothetical protein GLOIN_2v1541737 [Rhizophagus clarus]